MQEQTINWQKVLVKRQPHPKQEDALVRTEFEILYGWARGGGKTDAGMIRLLYDTDNPKYRGLVIRRNSTDLSDWISRAREMYSWLGVDITGDNTIKFPSGAIIRLWHLKDENAYTKYQGHEYHRVLIEELTQIPSEELYLRLIASCRSTVEWLKPQVFATTNPWEIWHAWVKKRFIDVAAPWVPHIDAITWRTRIFIPSRVEDNPTLMTMDPQYVKFLEWLPEDLRKAWRDGDRNVFDTKGSYYSQYIIEARTQNRVCKWVFDKNLPTYKFWDLWLDDNTVVIVTQFFGKEIRIVDCIYGTDNSIEYYLDVLKTKWYDLENHYYPHDIQVREMTSAMSRKQYLENRGIKVNITPNMSIEDAISLAKQNFNHIWFEQETTEKLLEALAIYRRRRDEKNLTFWKPIHDWSSDFADAFRYMMVNYSILTKPKLSTKQEPVKYFNRILGQRVTTK